MKQLDGTGLKRLHREWRRRSSGRVALVIDSVQSPFNLGAIVRTAA
ncbi:MAG: tRNA (guanosine-2-O-)-methyltransferase, partial [Acidimicrobiaceae bacterium]